LPILAATTAQWGMTLVVLALGCSVGSFLNVVIWRMPRGMSVRRPKRSFCPRCSTPIVWYDNLPVLSFLMLGRRCRACREPISWRYPTVELLTGLLFALVYFRLGVRGSAGPDELVIIMLVVALLVAGSAIDMDWFIIPDEINLFGILGGLLAGLLMPTSGLHVGDAAWHTFSTASAGPMSGLLASGIGVLVGGGTVLLCACGGYLIFRKEAMGIGDAKLMAMVGAFFGWKIAVVAFFISPFIGLVYGVPLLLQKGEHVMPYGPFLSVGAIVTVLFRAALCGPVAMF
jgi:leader peptidase (prepilin peptidase) / N-methyltransferase